MKKLLFIVCMCFVVSTLSGCLYPDDQLAQNQIPYEDQLQSVQTAVNKFKENNNGLLPIKNKDMNTPIYLKYPVDFTKLIPSYISDAPGNAYENGGVYQYVLIDAETNPTIKLIDLRIAEKIRDVSLRVQVYKDKNTYPPIKETLSKGVFLLNYKKMGFKEEPFVTSPYSQKNLPIVMGNDGEFYVDYSIDLFEKLNDAKKMKTGEDIRQILVKDSPILPAYSLPYTIKDGQPVFLEQN
ncbi:hypothetical protein [Gottfriedia solisilvae]|uniref:Lipoprotein n=1 Tax=Gottfriedia solisilvae TaxID=1516104 RepID=A0A8J3EXH8_9BACI|nr:hypothetical protein [Gottfriedia solisilvae]GGI12241.1 hypothetical protein GCM10007380_11900 [Gottfriedia solisilvae]